MVCTRNLVFGYRFGFNGMEGDNEVKGDGNSLDFGARIYDSRLGRWSSTDPLQMKYPYASPYNFVLNTPLSAIDPDGRLVVFVNGFRLDAFLHYLEYSYYHAEPSWESRNLYEENDVYGSYDYENNKPGSYWDNINDPFMLRFKDWNDIYIDGGYTPTSTAQQRYTRGVADGMAIEKRIKDGSLVLEKDDEGNIIETIKIVGHSHGGWHSYGVADYLKKAGYQVEALFMLNPHQPNGEVTRLSDVPDYQKNQYSRPSDLLSSVPSFSLTTWQNRDKYGLSTFDIRYDIANTLKNFGGSVLAKMPDIAEYHEMKNLSTIDNLGGHFVSEAVEIFDLVPSEEGYIKWE